MNNLKENQEIIALKLNIHGSPVLDSFELTLDKDKTITSLVYHFYLPNNDKEFLVISHNNKYQNSL
ncbi:hypothetical protein [Romboutsia sp.]|uniref:hypothetical protein n=1 Tax=Romboutsia sp. TaxID=1965302 RepID=UPI003F666469